MSPRDSSHAIEARLVVRDLRVEYGRTRGFLRRTQDSEVAVDGVSFDVGVGETLAIVGESGAGKSSVARAICGLASYHGEILLDGVELSGLSHRERRMLAPKLQMVFQNPYSSLDPVRSIGSSLVELNDLHDPLPRRARHDKVRHLLQRVGLEPAFADRKPKELSGGQLQRVAIARAVSMDPLALICDEAVSSLDVSTSMQVIALLRELVSSSQLSCVFITHDLAVVAGFADRVAVMYRGRLVEIGPASDIFGAPRHPYTQALVSSVPHPDPTYQRQRRAAKRSAAPAAPGTPQEAGPGCAYVAECGIAVERCSRERPPLLEVASSSVLCHLASETSIAARRAREAN